MIQIKSRLLRLTRLRFHPIDPGPDQRHAVGVHQVSTQQRHDGAELFGLHSVDQDGFIGVARHDVVGKASGPLASRPGLFAGAQVEGVKVVVVQEELRADAIDPFPGCGNGRS